MTAADRLAQVRAHVEQLHADLATYARDRDPEQRSIAPGLMLVRLKPLLELLTTDQAVRPESESK